MTFEELLQEFEKIKLQEKRKWSRQYCEAVIAKPHWPALTSVLESYFGPPLKPEGVQPSGQASGFAKKYGGVRDNQTLYVRKADKKPELALLWPWGDGSSLTLKVVREP